MFRDSPVTKLHTETLSAAANPTVVDIPFNGTDVFVERTRRIRSFHPTEPTDDTSNRVRHTSDMAIEHFGLLSEEGWVDSSVDQICPTNYWNEGGLLSDAPVDPDKTFKGNVWISSKVDNAFHLNGIRCAPNFSIPRRHSNLDGLVIVFGGQFTITWEEGEDTVSRTIGPGEFWTVTADTPYVMAVGHEGVTYLETWSEPIDKLEIYWHDDGWADR